MSDEANDLYNAGDYRKALAAYRKLARSEDEVDRCYRWLGIGECYMHLKQFDAARRAFDRFRREVPFPNTDAPYHWAGSAIWLAGRHTEATAVWQEALKCSHTDRARMETPLLLWFASVRDPSSTDVDVNALLRKRIMSSIGHKWPGPIARFVLGEIPFEAMLAENCDGARGRLCALFYSAWIPSLTDPSARLERLRECVSMQLADEYLWHLARGEVQLLEMKPKVPRRREGDRGRPGDS